MKLLTASLGLYLVLCNIGYFITNGQVLNKVMDFLQCNLCEVAQPEGMVGDCHCNYTTVNDAVKGFYSPLLKNITESTYFRYFKTDLEEECPHWYAENQCIMQKCSVDAMDVDELPKYWLGNVVPDADNESTHISDTHSDILEKEENDIYDWCALSEDNEEYCSPTSKKGVYVNLVKNPERYTGYKGPSAAKVWNAISIENCFSETGSECVERKTFDRLISGLRGSISTHVAMGWYYGDGDEEEGDTSVWGVNYPFYINLVGKWPDRVDNMYFTFLVMLRAVSKIQYMFPTTSGLDLSYYNPTDKVLNIDTGNIEEDKQVFSMLKLLTSSTNIYPNSKVTTQSGVDAEQCEAISNQIEAEQCRIGFDETKLFNVPKTTGPAYLQAVAEKEQLLRDIRSRFRNITSIMNCVTCEKCKVWGKLQILGMGTAIKLLLLTEDEIKAQVAQGKPVLNRQELIALINSFYHMAESVEFAQKVAETELKFKLSNFSFMSISFLQKIVNSMIATLRAMYYELSPKYRVALCCACIVCLMTFVFFVKFFMKKNRRTTGTNNYKKKQ